MTKKKTKRKTKRKKSKNAKVVQLKPEPKATINTACQHVEEFAVQLKGRAQEQKIRGAIVVEFGVDPKDGGIRQVGAVSSQEAAFAALLIQQMVMGQLNQSLI